MSLTISATGEIVDLVNSSVSMDIEQFVWNFKADVATKEDLQKLIPLANLGQNYIAVVFALGDATWNLIIEDTNCNDTDFSYSATGKSKTIILAEPYAKYITKKWLNTTAQAICNELCASSGIELSWQIINWPIVYYAADKRYPIDIISELVRDIGARLQTSPDGTLTVVYYPELSPGDLAVATALYQIDTKRNVFDRAEKFINRQNYDCVFVTIDSSLLSEPSISSSEIDIGNNKRLLNVYTTPFISHTQLNLQQESKENANLKFNGVYTERQIDDVIIEKGEGKLSRQFDSLVNVKWQQTEVGTLKIAENGTIRCSGGETGLATITYNTRYQQYIIEKFSNIAKTLIVSDEINAPILTTGSNPAPPIVVKTLSTPEALTARINAELRGQCDVKEYDLNVPYTGMPFLCGKIAKVNIIRESLGFNAWVKSVSVNGTGDEITQSVTVERPCY